MSYAKPTGNASFINSVLVDNSSIATGKTLVFDGTKLVYQTPSGGVSSVNGQTGAVTITNVTGTAGGLSANIAESQVTNLVSDLAGKLSLTGGTLTGGLLGTTITLSGVMNVSNGKVYTDGDGEQTWELTSGSATRVGKIAMATPGGSPAIMLFKGSTFTSPFAIKHVGTQIWLGFTTTGSGGSAIQISQNDDVHFNENVSAYNIGAAGNVTAGGNLTATAGDITGSGKLTVGKAASTGVSSLGIVTGRVILDVSTANQFNIDVSSGVELTTTGTPVDGQGLLLRLTGSGDQTILLDTSAFRVPSSVTIPTITDGIPTYITAVFNSSDGKFDVLGVLGGF